MEQQTQFPVDLHRSGIVAACGQSLHQTPMRALPLLLQCWTALAAAPADPAPYGDISDLKLLKPEEVLGLRATRRLQSRVSELLEKNRTVGLAPSEEQELDQYEYLDHLVRVAKARAHQKLHGG